jgi:hypothetical protein
MASVLAEAQGSSAPTSAGLDNSGGGRAVSTFYVAGTLLAAGLVELLGDTNAKGDGRLERVLPMAHPQYPWLYCEKILTIRGQGGGAATVGGGGDFDLEVPPTLPTFPLYPKYELVAEFTTKPYVLLQDSSIDLVAFTYYDTAGTSTPYHYAAEWRRFVDVEFLPKAEYLTGQQGQMQFRTTGSVVPNNKQFPASPRIVVPGGCLKVTWHQVPYGYVYSQSSYLTKYLGHVNQNSFLSYPAGSLLYDSFQAKRYTPPFPRVASQDWSTYVTAEKLCNVELLFVYTKRTAPVGYTPKTVPGAATRNDWIAGGHNLLPWLGDSTGGARGFYYVEGPDGHPVYPSAPFELMFSDPDVNLT